MASCFLTIVLSTCVVFAQTESDAIMMGKNQLCIGPMFGAGSWNQYWEGANKRKNENLGTVTTQSYSVMGNYGFSRRLNVLFGLPYIKTKASAGQLHSMKGLQDLSLWVKYMPVEMEHGNSIFSVYTIAGYSFPLTDYVADYLPLSIGLRSRNLSLRLMADYQKGNWFGTLSGTYVLRSNIHLDRNAYYTTQMVYSNTVDMPDAAQYNIRAGFRNESLIAEAVLANWTTLGGFDISKNNMPFPSNEMNATTIGINTKYNVNFVKGLSFTGGVHTTIAGRNVGMATNYNAGIFYIVDLRKKEKAPPTQN